MKSFKGFGSPVRQAIHRQQQDKDRQFSRDLQRRLSGK